MSDPILQKLDREWTAALKSSDYALAAKVLRSKINVLKSVGAIGEHKESLAEWIACLQTCLQDVPGPLSLTIIGHLRHARKALSISDSNVGSAFRSEISAKDRAKFRQRNRPPVLGIANRQDLPEGFANGRPSLDLRSGSLDRSAP